MPLHEPIPLLLTIAGPPDSVDAALQALRGNGFIQWGDAEGNIYAATSPGPDELNLHEAKLDPNDPDCPIVGIEAAALLKLELRRGLLAELDRAWSRAFKNPFGDFEPVKGYMTIDYRGLVPIPADIVRAGWKYGGEDWVKEHWNSMPPRHVASLEISDREIVPAESYYVVGGRTRKRRGAKTFTRRTAIVGIEAEYAWPWPIVKAIGRRWQDLYVNLEQDTGESAVFADRRLAAATRSSLQPPKAIRSQRSGSKPGQLPAGLEEVRAAAGIATRRA
jgi:hypothetical protein